MTQHADQPLLPARQPPLTFTREGPHLPRTVMAECQILLTRLLVEISREAAAAAATTSRFCRPPRGWSCSKSRPCCRSRRSWRRAAGRRRGARRLSRHRDPRPHFRTRCDAHRGLEAPRRLPAATEVDVIGRRHRPQITAVRSPRGRPNRRRCHDRRHQGDHNSCLVPSQLMNTARGPSNGSCSGALDRGRHWPAAGHTRCTCSGCRSSRGRRCPVGTRRNR